MRLTKRWHQILGSCGDVLLSHTTDCNAFGVESSAGLVMFDAGSGYDHDALLKAFAASGVELPTFLFLTHAHADHAGGAAAIVQHCGSSVWAGELTAAWMRDVDEEKISLSRARELGVYPEDYAVGGVPGIASLRDRQTVRLGDVTITAVGTSGHSDDHMSYLVSVDGETTLIAGDALFAGGRVILQDTWDSSVAKSCAAVRLLSQERFEMMLAGHGPAILQGAREHVDAALARINRLLPPLNFL